MRLLPFKIEEDTFHSGASAQAVVTRGCVGGSHLPADGYPGDRVTAMPDPGKMFRKGEETRPQRTPRR